MTSDERKRVGRRLRAIRIERGLNQADVAKDPKLGISLGTLQAIEGHWYDVRDTNIERYARVFGTTITKLLKADDPKTIAPADPLLRDLNEEHLEVARAYMRARKRLRSAIETLLVHPDEETMTTLVTTLANLAPDRLAVVRRLLTSERPEVLAAADQLLHVSPDVFGVICDIITKDQRAAAAPPRLATPTPPRRR